MFCLKYRVYNEMPLVLTSRAGDPNIVKTEQYIPGNMILGTLAKRCLDRLPKGSGETACDDSFFRECFVGGRMSFGPAYLTVEDADGEQQPYFPLPVSIRQEKYAEKLYDFLYQEEKPLLRTKKVKGFGRLNEKEWQKKEVETSLNFHHARDRNTGITDGEKIFTYESIDPGYCFEGCILGEKEDLQHLLDICDLQWAAYLGRSKNVQYGKIRFVFLQEEAREYASDSCLPAEWSDERGISLSLLSDTIIYNEHGFPSTDSKDLTAYLSRILGCSVNVEKARTRQGNSENFVGVWRLRTPSEYCFLAGSSFLLELGAYDAGKLADLEMSGIGERTHQGFGRCRFAWQTEKELKLQETHKPSLVKPEGKVPEMTREILSTLLVQTLEKKTEFLAIQAQSKFLRLPTNSLLGRLENTISNAASTKEWHDFLKDLRKTAKAQLEDCHNTRKSLLSYLLTEKIDARIVIKTSASNLQNFVDDFSLRLDKEDELNARLYKRYWVIFLSMMRKRKDREGGRN
ncbi:hypothetical protein CSB45_08660 [candidate division KSB3 bacterium]|uniref:CRISPR-associated RAMP protein Csx10 n=1 Tax=candidate division KSB3 bacterium TaxID=2044937 RepID=A0A2G6E4J7_9BACT|nr:MAG: hypothetical protein CSB45_08660 [candidate division KSB3 bacterium]PIE29708.1 MAG: hypothetical protein CSA57_07775 [candidate division KSB3 bacterium]